MSYPIHRGPNMSQYIRNMQQSYDRHQTGLEPGFEEELNRFVVSDWSADEFMSAPITTVAPDNQQAFDDFISQESIFEDQSDFLNDPVFLDPALSDDQLFATTSSTVTPPAPVDVAFYSDASNLSTQVADDTTLDLGSQVPETPDKEDYALPSDAQERARKLADEDKRRRNTAASARFRHKKKGQEKEMQKKIQAMANEIAELRNKVRKLEVEKTAYRDLLIAKTAGEPKGSEAGPAPAGAKHEAEAVKSTGHKRTRLENWA